MTTITRNVYVDGQRIAVATGNPATAASPRTIHTGSFPARLSTDGTDSTPSSPKPIWRKSTFRPT
jgi:hypothetical protein